jgi:hypothetical protein
MGLCARLICWDWIAGFTSWVPVCVGAAKEVGGAGVRGGGPTTRDEEEVMGKLSEVTVYVTPGWVSDGESPGFERR